MWFPAQQTNVKNVMDRWTVTLEQKLKLKYKETL